MMNDVLRARIMKLEKDVADLTELVKMQQHTINNMKSTLLHGTYIKREQPGISEFAPEFAQPTWEQMFRHQFGPMNGPSPMSISDSVAKYLESKKP